MDRDSDQGRYALLAGLWALAALMLPLLARARGRRIERMDTGEAAQFALAVFALSRIATQEKVAAFAREPFTEPKEGIEADGPLPGADLVPAGEGWQAAIGQLMTCSRCFGLWGAGGLVYARTLAPDHARVGTQLLALSGANFFLQAAFARLCEAVNAAQTDDESKTL
jgi:hypothetical protein